MSQENVEIIARLYENFLARPERLLSAEILEFFDPAVEIRQSASILGTEGTFHGYEGLLQSARELIESFQDVQFVPVAHVWALRADRIVAWHVYFDPAEALEAVGLAG
jgi:hypothetical protein